MLTIKIVPENALLDITVQSGSPIALSYVCPCFFPERTNVCSGAQSSARQHDHHNGDIHLAVCPTVRRRSGSTSRGVVTCTPTQHTFGSAGGSTDPPGIDRRLNQ